MIRDITLGQYYPSTSPIHKLDARLKIVATIAFILIFFMVKNFVGFAVSAVVLAILVKLSTVPIKFIMRGLKPILFIMTLTFCLNMFMIDGEILLQIGFLKVTKEGLYMAFFMLVRLILLIITSSLLTLCTKPITLTDGIERLLKPLSYIKVPSHEIAMMMSIALRFIPTLLEEMDKIMKAQKSRGADFETGGILKRAKSLVPILVPLFVSAFRIAQDLAMAMESRCYRGGKNRTRFHEMKLGGRDFIALVILIIFGAAIISTNYLI